MTNKSETYSASSGFGNPPGISKEWQEISTTFTSLFHKTMTQTIENLAAPSPSDETTTPLSNAWEKLWTKAADETRRTMAQNMEAFGIPSFGNIGNAVFDPEVMTKTFTAAMTKMREKPEKLEALRNRYLEDFQELLQSTLNNLQGKLTKIFLEPESNDKRFRDPAWNDNPFFSLLQQSYLLNARFLKEAVNSIEELDPLTRRKLMFYTSHLCDALSPTNFPLTNPTVLQETFASSGQNLVQGFQKYLEDARSGQWHTRMTDMKAFHLGKTLATTPGKVVFQNDIFQLIQYEPLSKRVAKRPLLIIPPWINKYYIFDLKPENSFVRWALESGLSVFIISWVNPDERHAHKTLTDYTLDGVKTAVDQVCKITGEKKLNAIGYCNGGTLLSFLLAYLKKKKENPIASATLLVSPFDFSKADDMGIYRCEHQQRKLEEYVQKKGYLEGKYMVQAFSLLRANDFIWSSYVNNYLLGREPFPFDMLYWNCDAVRMPATMHMTYLRDVVVENRLMTPGSLRIGDVPVDFGNITTPLLVMAAHEDHIAPWRSVYPITQMARSPSKKFILSTSGHVASVINHPSYQKYHYWTSDTLPEEPDDWLKNAQKHEGSWWNEWRQWLDVYGGGTIPAQPVPQARILEEAPGTYAFTVAE
ncbi:MAG: phbC [Alphaproteobacteria bacterium]|jgi:polyhydroxyalkanoate synthase|nr:phbC [Alphaproteobacteria bacterium]